MGGFLQFCGLFHRQVCHRRFRHCQHRIENGDGGMCIRDRYRTSGPSRLFYLREKNNFDDPKEKTSNAFVGPVPRKGIENGGDQIGRAHV